MSDQVTITEYRAILPVGTEVESDGVKWTRRPQMWESEYGRWGTPGLPLTIRALADRVDRVTATPPTDTPNREGTK